MTAAELAQGVQFTVDRTGQVTAVVVAPAIWQQILEALEDSEDRQLITGLQSRLAAGPLKSGALCVEDVTHERQSGMVAEESTTPVGQENHYQTASERQIALMTQGLDLGSQGTATWERDELHKR